MNENIVCIYHKDCVDGTTAAAVVLRAFPQAKLFPLSQGYTEEDFAVIQPHLQKGTVAYIVDCTLGITECIEAECTITVIDHHVSEVDRMRATAEKYVKVTYMYDVTKSGASLCFTYFFPEEALPELIKYVEDSDLWNGTYGAVTKDVVHYLSLFRNDPKKMSEHIEGDGEIVKERGNIISEYTDKAIAHLIQISPLILNIGEHHVLTFNITDHESACGHLLSIKHNQAVALFTIKGTEVRFSFRSNESNIPSALDLASLLGGGGHRNSSGARISLSDFLSRIDSK